MYVTPAVRPIFQAAIASGSAPYWMPKSKMLEPDADAANIPIVQLGSNAKLPASPAWDTHWMAQPATEIWNEKASALIVKYRLNPLRSVRTLALLHATMHDAGLRTEMLGLQQPAQSAATHVAASAMLSHFFPLESPGRLDALGESALAALTASQPNLAREIAQGASIGRGAVRLAKLRALNDGADEVWDARTRPSEKLGMWRGTPPLDSAHPQEPLAGSWQTWMLKNGGELQPPPPPAHDSEAFQLAAREVLEVSHSLTGC